MSSYSCVGLNLLSILNKKEVALKIKQSLLFNTMLIPLKEYLDRLENCMLEV